MTNFLIVLDVILGVILLGFLGFWAYNRIQAKRLGGELTNEEFKAGMRKAQIIDVRSKMEWDEGHPVGAVHIPMEEIPSRYGEFDFDRDIYLICKSGGRSAQVCRWLEMNGIDAINISGGMIDWEHAGRPIEKD